MSAVDSQKFRFDKGLEGKEAYMGELLVQHRCAILRPGLTGATNRFWLEKNGRCYKILDI